MEQKFLTGQKVLTGKYKCLKCGYILTVDENSVLPICPMCGFEE